MNRFKVGDMVRIRRDFKNKPCYANHEMMKKRGKIAKITNVGKLVTGKTIYYLDVDECQYYIFTDEMLEPVEEFEKGDLVEITKGKLKGVKGKVVGVGNYNAQLTIDNSTYITIKKDCVKLVEKAKEEGICSVASFGEKCKYILQGDKTTVILPSGTKGQVKLYKGDKYDKDLGIRLAYHKAKFNEAIKEIENN